MKTELDYTSLFKAHEQLQTSLRLAKEAKESGDVLLYSQFRSAGIQAFEYCFELSHKFLRRFLREYEASEMLVSEFGFKDLIRLAEQRAIIDDAEAWLHYRKQRNQTSHTYDSDIAEEVFATLPQFSASMAYLIKKMVNA
jgi:nucleotidyltransferase substrate binding protein (TIGR01987 family)